MRHPDLADEGVAARPASIIFSDRNPCFRPKSDGAEFVLSHEDCAGEEGEGAVPRLHRIRERAIRSSHRPVRQLPDLFNRSPSGETNLQ